MRRAVAVAVLLALTAGLPAVLVAQPSPAAPAPAAGRDVRLVLGVGAGSHLVTERYAFGANDGGVIALVGVRARVRSAIFAELAVQPQGTYAGGEDAVLRCDPLPPGAPWLCRSRELADDPSGKLKLAMLARLGVERALGRRGPHVRASVGGGRLWEVGRTFGGAAAGLSTRGRRLRGTLDVERWWYALPVVVQEARRPGGLVEVGREDVGATSTFVRLGLEVPIGGGRR